MTQLWFKWESVGGASTYNKFSLAKIGKSSSTVWLGSNKPLHFFCAQIYSKISKFVQTDPPHNGKQTFL